MEDLWIGSFSHSFIFVAYFHKKTNYSIRRTRMASVKHKLASALDFDKSAVFKQTENLNRFEELVFSDYLKLQKKTFQVGDKNIRKYSKMCCLGKSHTFMSTTTIKRKYDMYYVSTADFQFS